MSSRTSAAARRRRRGGRGGLGGVATSLGGGRFASHRGRLEFRRVPGSARLRRLRPAACSAPASASLRSSRARDLGAAGRLRGLNRGARLARPGLPCRGEVPRRGAAAPRPWTTATASARAPRSSAASARARSNALVRTAISRSSCRGAGQLAGALAGAPRLVVRSARARRATAGSPINWSLSARRQPRVAAFATACATRSPRRLPLDEFGLEQVGELGLLLGYIVRRASTSSSWGRAATPAVSCERFVASSGRHFAIDGCLRFRPAYNSIQLPRFGLHIAAEPEPTGWLVPYSR